MALTVPWRPVLQRGMLGWKPILLAQLTPRKPEPIYTFSLLGQGPFLHSLLFFNFTFNIFSNPNGSGSTGLGLELKPLLLAARVLPASPSQGLGRKTPASISHGHCGPRVLGLLWLSQGGESERPPEPQVPRSSCWAGVMAL